IQPANNSLLSLAQAINAAGAGVNATIFNVGSSNAPDYRLALESTALGDIPLQLNDGSQDLLSTVATGSPVKYQIDGQPSTPISSSTRTINVAPGLTANLLQAGDTTITLGQSASAVTSAISSFVSAYNGVVDELTLNHGANGGALSGQSLVLTLQSSLQ